MGAAPHAPLFGGLAHGGEQFGGEQRLLAAEHGTASVNGGLDAVTAYVEQFVDCVCAVLRRLAAVAGQVSIMALP